MERELMRLVGKLMLLPKTFSLLTSDPVGSQRPLTFVIF